MGSVTVVIPALDADATIGKALASVVLQGDIVDEVIVIDDGSSDATADAVESFATREGSGRVTLMQHPGGENRGVAASRNLGVRSARCPLVAFLDADDEMLEGSIRSRASAFRDHQEVELAYGVAVAVGVGPLAGRHLGLGVAARPMSLLPWLYYENPVPLSTVMARREALGPRPFPERLRHQVEDWLAWVDLSVGGARALFLDQPLVRYRVGPETWSGRTESSGSRLGQLVEEAEELRRRRSMIAAAQLRDATAYRAGIVLAEALGRLVRGRVGEARRSLSFARKISGSGGVLVRAAAVWVPRLKLHAWCGRAGTPAQRRLGLASRSAGHFSPGRAD